jgi:hypothetical protein
MRLAALAVAVMVLLFEGRFRMEDYQARHEFRFVPFRLQPGTMALAGRDGQEIVAVNGRPAIGASDYWREVLRYREATVYSGPFTVTVRDAQGRVAQVEKDAANCTCGKMTEWQTVWYAMMQPVVMALAGMVAILIWPRRWMAWLLLAFALSVAQMNLAPDGIYSFRETAEPREWTDWMRVPTVLYRSFFQGSWPGWALLLAGVGGRWRWLAAAPWLVLGVARMAMETGWAENAAATAWLWAWHEQYSTELTVLAMGISVLCVWRQGGWRRWAALVLLAVALGVFYWPAVADGKYEWVQYYDNTTRLEAAMPEFYPVPSLILGLYVAMLAAVAGRAKWGWAVALLCVPMVYNAAEEVYSLWGEGFTTDGALVAAYIGFAWLFVRIARRDAPVSD